MRFFSEAKERRYRKPTHREPSGGEKDEDRYNALYYMKDVEAMPFRWACRFRPCRILSLEWFYSTVRLRNYRKTRTFCLAIIHDKSFLHRNRNTSQMVHRLQFNFRFGNIHPKTLALLKQALPLLKCLRFLSVHITPDPVFSSNLFQLSEIASSLPDALKVLRLKHRDSKMGVVSSNLHKADSD